MPSLTLSSLMSIAIRLTLASPLTPLAKEVLLLVLLLVPLLLLAAYATLFASCNR